ncbi:nuclear transport factor 2 family protein [Actinosynnema sp. NPDC091369]
MDTSDRAVEAGPHHLVERHAVVEVCTRMAWHADQHEWEELRALFADEVRLDWTSLNGGEPAVLSPAQVVDSWSRVLGGFDATQHMIANHLVTLQGDTAVCTASFQATHRLADLDGPLWTVGGTYRFDLVRADRTWKIRGVAMTVQWADGNEALPAKAVG